VRNLRGSNHETVSDLLDFFVNLKIILSVGHKDAVEQLKKI